jgi:hypothetical protein
MKISNISRQPFRLRDKLLGKLKKLLKEEGRLKERKPKEKSKKG